MPKIVSDTDYRLNASLMQGRHADVIGLYESLPKSQRRRADTSNIYGCALILSGRAGDAFKALNAIPYGDKTADI